MDPNGHQQRREMPDLERAMLRRSVGAIGAACERCAQCRRTPLTGEHVYVFAAGELLCELCRALRRERPVAARVVLGNEHGHAVRIRIIDNRSAA